MTDEELYQEEQRKLLIDLKASVDTLAGAVEKQNNNYVAPKENVAVTGEVTVNTEKSVEISNMQEFTDALDGFKNTLKTAIETNSYKPLKNIVVDNIKDAKPTELKINNLSELAQYFTTLRKDIENNKSITKVVQQQITFPTSPKQAIPVRLSDGKSFYNALYAAMSSGSEDQRMTFTGTKLNVSSSNVGDFVNFEFDSVYAAYPDTLTEVYTYKLDGDTVGTITVIYVASDKKELVSCIRS